MSCGQTKECNHLSSIEDQVLQSYAAFSRDICRQKVEDEDYRLPYRRDVDQIVHSKAYSRYADKTQVVYLVADDHITHRVQHVQLVSQFARGVASVLRLNGDLVEAIALGHDVGHPPFGHEGETYLNELSIEYGNGPFAHNWQSCRLLREIEPLNLGLAVYDGFLCHSGGLVSRCLKPAGKKSWEDHFKEMELRKNNPKQHFFPFTLEGCLVKLCDKICYIGKDIEDAMYLGMIKQADIPSTILGNSNESIVRTAAKELIRLSLDQEAIQISEELFQALEILRNFNFERIYNHPKIKVESKKIKFSYRILFEYLLNDLQHQRQDSYLGNHYLHDKSASYLEQTSDVQKVVDYIAGMTDNFFMRTFEKLLFPKPIDIKPCSHS